VTTLDRDYDIYEKLPDSSVRFLIRVHGTRHVPSILKARGEKTTNECFAKNIRTGEIIGRVNDKAPRRVTSSDSGADHQWPGLSPIIGK
jgi:hypothetical protein